MKFQYATGETKFRYRKIDQKNYKAKLDSKIYNSKTHQKFIKQILGYFFAQLKCDQIFIWIFRVID